MKIEIQVKALKALSLLAAKKDIRYYLNGVLIEATRAETRIVATTGNILGAYRHMAENDLDGNTCLEFILPIGVVGAVKTGKMDWRRLILERSFADRADMPVTLRDDVGGTAQTFAPVVGVFPDYRRVIPKACNCEPSQVNTEYLDTFRKVAVALTGSKGAMPHVMHDKGGRNRVTIPDEPKFVGVLMGIHERDGAGEYDAWPELEADQQQSIREQRVKLTKVAA